MQPPNYNDASAQPALPFTEWSHPDGVRGHSIVERLVEHGSCRSYGFGNFFSAN